MEGYSVAKIQQPQDVIRYRVYKDDTYVGAISAMYNGRMGWDWHSKDLWQFRACDFVNA